MKSRVTVFTAVLFAALFLYNSLASAGMILVSESRSEHPAKPGDTMISEVTTYLGEKSIRIEQEPASGDDTVLLYHSEGDLLQIINEEEGTYREFTREDMKRMGERLEEARRQFERQMAQVPPEQRPMMKEMLESRMPAQREAREIEYRKAESGIRVNNWRTDRYEGYAEGEKVAEAWVVEPEKLGLDEKETALLRNFFEYMKELGKYMPSSEVKTHGMEEGVPVRQVGYEDGRVKYKTELKETRRKNLADSLFKLPEGLRESEPMQPGM